MQAQQLLLRRRGRGIVCAVGWVKSSRALQPGTQRAGAQSFALEGSPGGCAQGQQPLPAAGGPGGCCVLLAPMAEWACTKLCSTSAAV